MFLMKNLLSTHLIQVSLNPRHPRRSAVDHSWYAKMERKAESIYYVNDVNVYLLSRQRREGSWGPSGSVIQQSRKTCFTLFKTKTTTHKMHFFNWSVSGITSLASHTLCRERKGLITLQIPTSAKHVVTTNAIYEECGSHWSWQVSVVAITRLLQCDQTLPISVWGVTCKTMITESVNDY